MVIFVQFLVSRGDGEENQVWTLKPAGGWRGKFERNCYKFDGKNHQEQKGLTYPRGNHVWSPRVEKITKIKSKKDLHIPGAITSEAWGVAVGANLKDKFDGKKILKIESKNVLRPGQSRLKPAGGWRGKCEEDG